MAPAELELKVTAPPLKTRPVPALLRKRPVLLLAINHWEPFIVITPPRVGRWPPVLKNASRPKVRLEVVAVALAMPRTKPPPGATTTLPVMAASLFATRLPEFT